MILALLLAQAAVPPAAPQPVCPTTPARLPAELSGWARSGETLESLRAVTVPTMDPATVRLADMPPPQQFGRMALTTVRITKHGTYGIALGAKGWIDLYRVGDRTPLTSVKHGHGPDCSGIRKIVRYTLTPGNYRVVVGGLEAKTAKLLLVR